MAQFVLVNVVVAVLMKHLEESHKQLDEDEDYEIDLEIAREIEAERKALIEAIERRNREKDLKVRRPLMKMASLPSNFTFTFATNLSKPPFELSECSQLDSMRSDGMQLFKQQQLPQSQQQHKQFSIDSFRLEQSSKETNATKMMVMASVDLDGPETKCTIVDMLNICSNETSERTKSGEAFHNAISNRKHSIKLVHRIGNQIHHDDEDGGRDGEARENNTNVERINDIQHQSSRNEVDKKMMKSFQLPNDTKSLNEFDRILSDAQSSSPLLQSSTSSKSLYRTRMNRNSECIGDLCVWNDENRISTAKITSLNETKNLNIQNIKSNNNNIITNRQEPSKRNDGMNSRNDECINDRPTNIGGIMKKSHSLRVRNNQKKRNNRKNSLKKQHRPPSPPSFRNLELKQLEHEDDDFIVDQIFPNNSFFVSDREQDDERFHHCNRRRINTTNDVLLMVDGDKKRPIMKSKQQNHSSRSDNFDLNEKTNHCPNTRSIMKRKKLDPNELEFTTKDQSNESRKLTTKHSPVTIKIDAFNSIEDDHSNRNDLKRSRSTRSNSSESSPLAANQITDLLTTTLTTTTASPSQILSTDPSDYNYRKLSDFLDEESGPISPGILVSYPEFDSICFDNLNHEYDEDDDDQFRKINHLENSSLASIESWPSGDPSDN